MSFKKITAEVTFTNKFPEFHTKSYTDFDLLINNKERKLDDEAMKAYFEKPFADEKNIFTIKVKGDDLNINEDQFFSFEIKRHQFENIDVTPFVYAKVKLYYDETKFELKYCWILKKNLINNNLSFMNFVFLIDYFPTNYEAIKKQIMQVTIDRRSFYIYKNTQISIKEEQLRRLERQDWNIECDVLCAGNEALYYNHHFKSKKRILGRYIFSVKPIESCDPKTSICVGRPTFLENLICTIPPCSISLTPMFRTTYNAAWILLTGGSSPIVLEFTNYYDTNQKFNALGGDNIIREIKDQRPELEVLPQYLMILLIETDEKSKFPNFNPLPFQLSVNEFNNEFNYNNFKNVIPLHFQQFHTKYIIRNNQDDVNEIPTNLVFLDGFSLEEEKKWIDDINLHISYRIGSENTIYDVYWRNSSFPKKYEFIQTNNKVILSFNNWMKVYVQENDWERYLRSNYEQRKIAQQAQVKDYLLNTTKAVLGGAFLGFINSAKLAAITAATGLPGWAIGASLGWVTILGKFFIDEVSGTSERKMMEARERDLQNSNSPPTPSEVGANYFTIFSSTNGDENELKLMHPLAVFVTEMVGFGWEWKYDFQDYQTLGKGSQKLLENLINFGEKCNRTIRNFNLFDFIIENQTDQKVFYIHCSSASPTNEPHYSNIFTTSQQTLTEILLSGIRFHIKYTDE